MKECGLILNCAHGLHFRPLRVLVDIAILFNGCEVYIVYDNDKVDLSGDNYTQLAMLTVPNGSQITLGANGKNEVDVLAIMCGLLQNISMLPYDIKPSTIQSKEDQELFAKSNTSAALALFEHISDIIDSTQIDMKTDLLLGIKSALNISDDKKVCRLEATLNSRQGMHILPSTLISKLRDYFTSSVELLYMDPQTGNNSFDAFNILELLQSRIKDGRRVTIVARGVDCEKAGKAVKAIMENMQSIAEEFDRHKRIGEKVDEKRILGKYLPYDVSCK